MFGMSAFVKPCCKLIIIKIIHSLFKWFKLQKKKTIAMEYGHKLMTEATHKHSLQQIFYTNNVFKTGN